MKLKKSTLVEIDTNPAYDPNSDISLAMDRAYKLCKQAKTMGMSHSPHNILIKGATATGKSTRIKAWAEAKGIELISISPDTYNEATMSVAAPNFGDDGKPDGTFSTLRPRTMDMALVKPSVLFIDELPRFSQGVLTNLMITIDDHTVQGPEGKRVFLPHLLFVVAAGNFGTQYDAQDVMYDVAKRRRFGTELTVDYDYAGIFRTYEKKCQNAIENVQERIAEAQAQDDEIAVRELQIELREWLGRIELYRCLLLGGENGENPPIQFKDTPSETDETQPQPMTLPSKIEELVMASDGTASGLIQEWEKYGDKSDLETVKTLLANYNSKSVDDKANSIFKTDAIQSIKKTGEDVKDDVRTRLAGGSV